MCSGGVISYSNAVKQSVLNVSAETLAQHGAVSVEVAEEMARGVRHLTGATYCDRHDRHRWAERGDRGQAGWYGVPGTRLAMVQPISHRYQLWGNREWVKLLDLADRPRLAAPRGFGRRPHRVLGSAKMRESGIDRS